MLLFSHITIYILMDWGTSRAHRLNADNFYPQLTENMGDPYKKGVPPVWIERTVLSK
jgi:hypothetical protein